jgi:nicotinate-nucleotide adenylyltransferase
LRVAIEAREQLRLDHVRLIPSARPPHRGAPEISAQRRAQWLRLAIGDEAGLCVDERELHRDGPSYTVDTLRQLRDECPGCPLFLLVGEDAARKLTSWSRWSMIADLAHLVVTARPGAPAELEDAVLERFAPARDIAALHAQAQGLRYSLAIPPLDISSSGVRSLLRAGRSIRGLVPESIIENLNPDDLKGLTHHESAITD